MIKKVIILLVVIVVLAPRCFAFANIEISEIMYNLKTGSDVGREWVEIYNNSNKPLDILAFRFFENDVNHKFKLTQGDSQLAPMTYAVIVSNPDKFTVDWPGFSGTILDSAFTLNNSGETLMIKDGDSVLDRYTYISTVGASGNGKSLQKINGVWKEGTPTPGYENKVISNLPTISKEKVVTTPTPEKIPEQNIDSKIISDVSHSGVTADVVSSNPASSKNNLLYIFGLVGMLALAGGLVYFVRRKKSVAETGTGDDFEILDE